MIGHRGYNLLIRSLLPLLPLYLGWRGIREPAYRHRWNERLIGPSGGAPTGGIWLHAASMGEVQAIAPVLRTLRTTRPELPLVVTTQTPTGAAHLQRLFGEHVFHSYLPIDTPGAIRRFYACIQPRVGLIVDMELWPNLFLQARQQRIPLLLINARLSEQSAQRYRWAAPLMREVLRCPSRIAAQTREDAQRLVALGAAEDRLVVTGSLKFDQTLPASTREQGEVLRRELGGQRSVWIAASTRDGEEEQVLTAHARVCQQIDNALLILVPRHPERFPKVRKLCRDIGMETVTRTSGRSCTASTRVYLVDTLGELPVMYASSDLAFVGGSLVPEGGHNVLEPASLGLPILVGPHSFKAREIVERLLAVDACEQVKSIDQLADTVSRLMQEPERRARMGRAAARLVEANRGVDRFVLAEVERCLARDARQQTQ